MSSLLEAHQYSFRVMLPTSSNPTATPFLLLFSQEEYRADLRTVLREELRQVIREELAAQAANPANAAMTSQTAVAALLSVKEAAAFLDVCVASIHA